MMALPEPGLTLAAWLKINEINHSRLNKSLPTA